MLKRKYSFGRADKCREFNYVGKCHYLLLNLFVVFFVAHNQFIYYSWLVIGCCWQLAYFLQLDCWI